MPSLILPDGRQLCFDELGKHDGFPVVYCHGFPASRIEASFFADTALAAGIRLIVPDRPGFGASDFQANRSILDWPGDIRALVEHLDIDDFSVLGVSGGAPYALACARDLNDRVQRLGLVCGLGPLHPAGASRGMGIPARCFIFLARKFPAIARPLYSHLVGPVLGQFPELAMVILNAAAPACDKEVLRDTKRREVYLNSCRGAFQQGGQGPAHDLMLYTQPWGFAAENIKTPTFLWHGEADRTVPVAMGRAYAGSIPGCQAEFLSGEGHFSLPFHAMDRILTTLRT